MKNELLDSIVNLGFSIFNLIMNSLVVLFTFFIPKNPRRVLIGLWRGNRFADNARYCYLEISKLENVEVNLVVNDKKLYKTLKEQNLNVVKKYSLKSIYLHVTSKYHIIDQDHKGLLGYLSVNAVRINLWHGIPIKKIWRLQLKDKKNKLAYIIERLNQTIRKWCKGYCSIGRWHIYDLLVPSQYDWDNLFSKCIFLNLVKPIFAKYPRVDYLQGNVENVLLDEEKEYIQKIEDLKKQKKKIFLYAPTFRDESDTLLLGLKTKEEIQDFIKYLADRNIVLVIKMHAVEKKKVEGIENCIVLDSKCDISIFMKLSDCLITDFSSVYFDYLILDKPIIFYPYDYEAYVSKDRGFMVDINDYIPGDRVYNIEDVKKLVDNLSKNNWQDEHAKDRKELKEKLWDDSYRTVGEYIGEKINKE